MTPRVLIFGAAGMLGHKLYQQLSRDFDISGTIRTPFATVSGYGIFEAGRIISEVNATVPDQINAAVKTVQPDVVVNCVGVVKSLEKEVGMVANVSLNALLPHLLQAACERHHARLIQISTDCVFLGQRGGYREADSADAGDVYGRTKYLGEVSAENALTLRTSFIGRELATSRGLVEWFLSNRGGEVKGFSRAVFSGLTSLELSRVIGMLIRDHPGLSGIYHLAAKPIDKFRLLTLVRDAMQLDIKVAKDGKLNINRSLNADLLKAATGYRPPDWETMIREMAADATPYDGWRTA